MPRLKQIACINEVQAMFISIIYPPDLNVTAGLLQHSIASNAASLDFERHFLTFRGSPFGIVSNGAIYLTKVMHRKMLILDLQQAQQIIDIFVQNDKNRHPLGDSIKQLMGKQFEVQAIFGYKVFIPSISAPVIAIVVSFTTKSQMFV